MLMNNQTQSTQPWPLYLASEGERVQVIDLKGDQVLLRTLSAMGINHGTILEILRKNANHCPPRTNRT
jgi:Fe2+ transport system protein FeoA